LAPTITDPSTTPPEATQGAPRKLWASPSSRTPARIVTGAGCVAAVAALALLVPVLSDSTLAFLTGVFVWAAMAGAWGLVAGAGYVSLATAGWYGLGAYSTAVLINHFHVAFFPAAIISGVWIALLAALVGAPLFRLRTHYFIMGSFIIAELVRMLMQRATFFGLDGGAPVQLPPAVSGDPRRFNVYFYLVALGFVTVALAVLFLVRRSRMGFGLRAIAQDESTAALLGVPTVRYKLLAFALSSGIIAVAGGINAYLVGYLQQTTAFSLLITVKVLVMSVAGGLGSILGPLAGAGLVQYIEQIVGPDLAALSQVVYGVIVMLIVVLLPTGLVPGIRAQAARALARLRRSSDGRPDDGSGR
jgi:branched-chain amino acid transport system permease protein